MIILSKKRIAPQHYKLLSSLDDRITFGKKVYRAITQDMPRNEEQLDEVLNALYNLHMLSFDSAEEAYHIAYKTYTRYLEESK